MTSKMDRRTFLQGTSIAALTSLMPTGVEALTPRAAKPTTPTGPTSTPTSSKFNGGRSQVNLNDVQVGGDYPFLNCMKTAQVWSVSGGPNPVDPSALDSNGYPRLLTYTGVNTVFFVPSQADRPGNYAITWSGNGTIWLGMSHTLVSGSKSSINGNGRFVISTTESRFVVGISAIGNPYITNLQVFHVNDEEALKSGQVFGQKFISRLKEANFGVIRFLSWHGANVTNVTTWETRRPIDYVFYSGSDYRSSLYAGTTKNVGRAYSVQFPGFVLIDKATVIVKFTASNNGPSTLNVNGTGDINILSEYGTPLSEGGNSFPVGGTWQSLATLIYDATLNAWIKHGGDIAIGSSGIQSGVPVELMVRLCAEVGAHPHFVAPPLALDPITDFIPKLAEYCRDNAPSWMVPRFEGPNELWNTAGGFFQTTYAMAKSNAYGWGNDYHNWYGKVMSIMGQAVSAAYGGDRSRYQVLCGVQTAMGSDAYGTASHNDRLASSKYLSQSAPPQAPYTKTPASKWVTHICCAQYYTPSDYKTPQETSYAAAYATADAGRKDSIANAYAMTSNSGAGPFTLSKGLLLYKNWKLWAKGFGVYRMCGYEGGYSPDFDSGGASQADKLRAASKLAPSLYGFTSTNYNNFVQLSDSSFTAEFPATFLSGTKPCSNAWSVLDDIYQQPNPPQWNAIVDFNRG